MFYIELTEISLLGLFQTEIHFQLTFSREVQIIWEIFCINLEY